MMVSVVTTWSFGIGGGFGLGVEIWLHFEVVALVKEVVVVKYFGRLLGIGEDCFVDHRTSSRSGCLVNHMRLGL